MEAKVFQLQQRQHHGCPSLFVFNTRSFETDRLKTLSFKKLCHFAFTLNNLWVEFFASNNANVVQAQSATLGYLWSGKCGRPNEHHRLPFYQIQLLMTHVFNVSAPVILPLEYAKGNQLLSSDTLGSLERIPHTMAPRCSWESGRWNVSVDFYALLRHIGVHQIHNGRTNKRCHKGGCRFLYMIHWRTNLFGSCLYFNTTIGSANVMASTWFGASHTTSRTNSLLTDGISTRTVPRTASRFGTIVIE